MIKLTNITKAFRDGKKEKHVLQDVNIHIQAGELVSVMGRSGAGKTTLLKIMSGITRPDSGNCSVKGKEMQTMSKNELADFRLRNIGFIFQNYPLIDRKNVFENIALPLGYMKRKSKDVSMITKYWLEKLQITDLEAQYPATLSGGEKQRVAIARSLVTNPAIILADEPTGSLDEETEDGILDIFKAMHQEGKTIVIITHDTKVANICEENFIMKNGSLVKGSLGF